MTKTRKRGKRRVEGSNRDKAPSLHDMDTDANPSNACMPGRDDPQSPETKLDDTSPSANVAATRKSAKQGGRRRKRKKASAEESRDVDPGVYGMDVDNDANNVYGPGRDMLSALDDYLVEQLKKGGDAPGKTLSGCRGCHRTATLIKLWSLTPGASAGGNLGGHAVNDHNMDAVPPLEEQEFHEAMETGSHMESESGNTHFDYPPAAPSLSETANPTNTNGFFLDPNPSPPSNSPNLHSSNDPASHRYQRSRFPADPYHVGPIRYTPICDEPLGLKK
ncbi:MAG: hypothetical protein Q9174_001202 [Haloplaca sp. 1 TL-2023]